MSVKVNYLNSNKYLYYILIVNFFLHIVINIALFMCLVFAHHKVPFIIQINIISLAALSVFYYLKNPLLTIIANLLGILYLLFNTITFFIYCSCNSLYYIAIISYVLLLSFTSINLMLAIIKINNSWNIVSINILTLIVEFFIMSFSIYIRFEPVSNYIHIGESIKNEIDNYKKNTGYYPRELSDVKIDLENLYKNNNLVLTYYNVICYYNYGQYYELSYYGSYLNETKSQINKYDPYISNSNVVCLCESSLIYNSRNHMWNLDKKNDLPNDD